MMMTKELSAKFNFETKYISRERTRCGTYHAKNTFDFKGISATLVRHGFTITPYKLNTDFNGFFTGTCWLWKAWKKGYQIEIFFNAPITALS